MPVIPPSPLHVVCTDDSGKPESVKNWIVKDEVYTVVEIVKAINRPGEYAFKLAEVHPGGMYESFRAKRFDPLETNALDEALAILNGESVTV
jgi:hypothetical protein